MLTAKESVLVIIDVQGKLAQIMNQSSQLHHNLTVLITGAQLLDIPIIWLEQLPEKLGATSPELSILLKQSTSPIAKSYFSAWQSPQVQTQLEQLKRPNILLAGIETHVCVCTKVAKTFLSRTITCISLPMPYHQEVTTIKYSEYR
jgi:nicotinamidase-related amidase